MSWLDSRKTIQSRLRMIDKSVILVSKDTLFWKILANILAFIRVMETEDFLKYYATTIGPIQAYPSDWDAFTVEEIGIHESRHTLQARWFGLGISPWLGLIPMAVAYLLLPLPAVFAWVRYRLELDAEVQLWKYILAQGMREESFWRRVEYSALGVSSSHYFFSVPRAYALWGYKRKAKKVLAKALAERSRLIQG